MYIYVCIYICISICMYIYRIHAYSNLCCKIVCLHIEVSICQWAHVCMSYTYMYVCWTLSLTHTHARAHTHSSTHTNTSTLTQIIYTTAIIYTDALYLKMRRFSLERRSSSAFCSLFWLSVHVWRSTVHSCCCALRSFDAEAIFSTSSCFCCVCVFVRVFTGMWCVCACARMHISESLCVG